MAAGLGEASAVAGLISLTIQLFDGCVKGFILISAAQEFGSKGDVLRCRLDWEHYRLSNWAATVGLFKNPPELNVPYHPIVQSTLQNLEQLLTNAEKLRRDYGLDVTITDEEIKEVQAPMRTFGQLLGKATPRFVNDTARVYSRRKNVWHKIKWGSMDAKKFGTLLQDIGYFNERLLSVLHPMDRKIDERESNAVMRTIVARSPDKALLDGMARPLDTVDRAIAASARLRQKGLLLNLFDPPSSPASGPTPASSQGTLTLPIRADEQRKYSPARISRNFHMQRDPNLLDTSHGQVWSTMSREIVQYSGRHVVLEWKDVEKASESRLRHRIDQVANFLSSMQDSTFHSLPCLGFLKEPKSGRYAYMFEPPQFDARGSTGIEELASTSVPSFSMKSLDDLFGFANLRPSLNQRLLIATTLAEALLQLHTAGWLHKCIRPDNVLFFKASGREWHRIDDNLYLSGYEYARADSPLEMTEEPSALRHAKLYRHPLSLGQGRASFIKAFDLYSLGCVLVELGFWSPLQTILLHWLRSARNNSTEPPPILAPGTILTPHHDVEYYEAFVGKQRLLQASGDGSIKTELEYRMGSSYTDVAMNCLHAGATVNGVVDGDYDDSLEVQEKSLAVLRGLLEIV